MDDLIEQLLAESPVITDGAWGTQLQSRGLSGGDCPDALNLSHPDWVEEVPRAYVASGSRVVLTNTFRANRVALAPYGLADQADAINRAGGEISVRAAQGRAAVFGSIGPCGKMLMTRELSAEELRDAFREQAGALAAAGVNALVIETMSDLEEAKLALLAAKETGLPATVCLLFDSGKQKDRTMMGNTPEQAARELADCGADVIGANCGQGIESYVEVCRQLRSATDLPLWIKPNAGAPHVEQGRVVYRTTPEQFAAHGPALVEAGASFVGGCCGTGPDFIRALKRRINP
ncbi:MAG: homocysteine S-methyltransferase family protein [Planctomycetales bacterium]|nr:homocysteine S-methyltransferase family protein [Planctomycetales bacterium]